MRYLEHAFMVPMGGSRAYRDGWERTFRGDMSDLPAGAPDPEYARKAAEHAEVLRARCADCGTSSALVLCRCGATVCGRCRAAYHGKDPRLGCANFAGKQLAARFAQFTQGRAIGARIEEQAEALRDVRQSPPLEVPRAPR